MVNPNISEPVINSDQRQTQPQPQPRFLKQNYSKDKNIKERCVEWVKQKLQYKSFRIQVLQGVNKQSLNEKQGSNKSNETINVKYLEELFPLIVFNSMAITYYINRRYSLGNKIFKTIGMGSLSYLMLIFYAEEQLFYRQMLSQNSFLCQFIRKEFISQDKIRQEKYQEELQKEKEKKVLQQKQQEQQQKKNEQQKEEEEDDLITNEYLHQLANKYENLNELFIKKYYHSNYQNPEQIQKEIQKLLDQTTKK